MVLGRRFVLKHHFDGNPKREDFDLVEEELPPLKVNNKHIYICIYLYSINSKYFHPKYVDSLHGYLSYFCNIFFIF